MDNQSQAKSAHNNESNQSESFAANQGINKPDQTGSMASDGPVSQNEVRGKVDLNHTESEPSESNQFEEGTESSLDADERSGGSVL